MDSLIITLVILAVIFFLFGRAKPDVDGEEARRLVKKEGAKLVDVRSPGEFASGHIAGAKNIPVGDLGARLDDLGDKLEPIIVYCASGMRSARAKRLLQAAGFQKVRNLGSQSRW